MTSLPDLSDQHSEKIQIGKLALQSFGAGIQLLERFIQFLVQMITLL
jgi:hypothetical protein